MSDLDLTEAADVAARAVFADDYARYEGFGGDPVIWEDYRHEALIALTASAPLIESQVRAKVAAEIEAYRGPVHGVPLPDSVGHWIDSADAYQAARIARGDS